MCEAVLRIGGWGYGLPSGDPHVPFDPTYPLFVPDPTANRYHTAPDRLNYFAPQSFPAAKATNEFRIFALGGSTVQGRPFSAETAFPTWLQLGLRAADPNTEWTVVNCGGISYASYRLLPVLREVLTYQPDTILLYTGHNEFLEEQMVRTVEEMPAWRLKVQAWGRHWHTIRAVSALRQHRSDRRVESYSDSTRMPSEVAARLDSKGGLSFYQRDDAGRRQIFRQFERNLERMVRLCRDAGVPLVLMNPVSDLMDTPPFKIANNSSLSSSARRTFDEAWDQARAGDLTTAERRETLRRAVSIDPRHAGAHYLLGRHDGEHGRHLSARAALIRAKEEDLCPLRMLEPMHQSILAIARAHKLPLVDVRALIAERSNGNIPDNTWLVDHVHPSIRGHQTIAEALLFALADAGSVTLSPGWRERMERLVEQQFASLDKTYHVRGQRQLHYLRLWREGRAERIHPAPGDLPPKNLKSNSQ